MASFSYQASWYQVETRARVIVFDVAGFEAARTLQRRSSSLISHSVHHASGPLTRDHGGLMSWPEHFFKARQHHKDLEKTNGQENNLSARVMLLSIYVSMINNATWHARSLPRIGNRKLSPSRFPSNYERPLVSVKSEGASTIRRKFVQQNKAPAEHSSSKEDQARDESSDESGAEDEHIIRIDSTNKLSFRHAS